MSIPFLSTSAGGLQGRVDRIAAVSSRLSRAVFVLIVSGKSDAGSAWRLLTRFSNLPGSWQCGPS